jgi:hypothetical protein
MVKGIKQGVGIALGVLLTCGVFAFTVSGPIKTWVAGETLTHTDLNQNVASLKAAIEGATQLGWSSFSVLSATGYWSFMARDGASSEAMAQFPMPRAATVKNIRVTPYGNTCTVTSTVTLRVNGTDAVTLSIPSGSTVPVTTTATVNLAVNDLVNWAVSCSNGLISGMINFEF